MVISLGTKKERAPIIIIDLYIGIALLLYYLGPIRFHSPYSIFMGLYIILFLIIINCVYFRVVHKHNNRSHDNPFGKNIQKTVPSESLPLWFYICGALIPLIMVVSSVLLTGFSGLKGSLTSTMAQTYTFIQSGGRYQEGIDIPMWIYMHFAVFVYLTIVDGLLFLKENSFIKKLLWAASLILLIGYFVLFRGAQKTLGDVFILCASAIFVRMYCTNRERRKLRKGKILLLLLMVVAFAIILASIMGARISYLGKYGYEAFKIHTSFWDVDLNYPLLSLLPQSTMLGFACLIFYLCNGFCGLSYCLASPLTWTYGLGTFPDLADVLGRRLGIDIFERTYMYKAYETYGWHHSEYWHTLFPYIASDVTFIGALIVMGFVTYIYATCWLDILETKNTKSIYLFAIMNIIWIYLPCNNQIFSTRTTGLVVLICFIMWIRRNKYAPRMRIKVK